MVDKGLFLSGQYTYMRLNSTATHLLKNTDGWWYSVLDLGKLLGLSFINLKKAVGTADHELLYKESVHYGVQQVV